MSRLQTTDSTKSADVDTIRRNAEGCRLSEGEGRLKRTTLRVATSSIRCFCRGCGIVPGIGAIDRPSNPAHALDGGIPRLFHTERHCPAASDVHRWAR